MKPVYVAFGSLLLFVVFFLWRFYQSRTVAHGTRTDDDPAGWLLVCLLLVAAFDFALLVLYLAPKF